VLQSKKEENTSSNSNSNNSSSSSGTILSPDDMENMTSQLKTFYFAGHDTTATTISWAYWLLVQHPDTLKKARDEVMDCLGQEWVDAVTTTPATATTIIPNNNNNSMATYEKLQQCEYLDAVARETLRLYPPAASTRYAVDPDAHFENYKLGDSIVHLNFYAIQRDPDVWGSSGDVEKFVPERFMGEEGRKLMNSFSFLPFSKGSRDCIGKYFALLETKIALAALITRYDGVALASLLLDDEDVVDDDDDDENENANDNANANANGDIDINEKEVYMARLTSIPKNGCKVKLSRRLVAPSS